MEEVDLPGLQEFLSTYPRPAFAAMRNAPLDDEPVTEEDRRAIEEGWASVAENGGRWYTHEEVRRELGLTAD